VPAITYSQEYQQKTKKCSEQQAAASMFILVIPGFQEGKQIAMISKLASSLPNS
jgi:hypothetical protein